MDNIWINFNAGHIGGTYFTRVRTLLRILDEIIGLNNVVLYYSHLKKEINPHMKDERAAASDILTQFFAADFIGINREPSRRIVETPQEKEERIKELIMKGEFKSVQEYESMLNYHKARIFDPNTYYYYKLDKYKRTEINIAGIVSDLRFLFLIAIYLSFVNVYLFYKIRVKQEINIAWVLGVNWILFMWLLALIH